MVLVTGAQAVQAVQGAGATFPAPLIQKWAADYRSQSGVEVLGNATQTRITNNTIGLNGAGTSALPNALYGVFIHNGANGSVIDNNTISGNSAGIQGGGVNFQSSVGLIENSTLSGNSTPPDGAGSAARIFSVPNGIL